MAYLLQYHETAVMPYLFGLDLSREARVVLATALHQELRLHGDVYMNNPARRLAPGSDCFRFDLVFRDPASKVIHQLRLIISDTAARYGILRVEYAEDEAGSSSS